MWSQPCGCHGKHPDRQHIWMQYKLTIHRMMVQSTAHLIANHSNNYPNICTHVFMCRHIAGWQAQQHGPQCMSMVTVYAVHIYLVVNSFLYLCAIHMCETVKCIL
ncbi:TPA: hypothetical protein ACH3X1_014654 [Trebouxia sp. C0004]